MIPNSALQWSRRHWFIIFCRMAAAWWTRSFVWYYEKGRKSNSSQQGGEDRQNEPTTTVSIKRQWTARGIQENQTISADWRILNWFLDRNYYFRYRCKCLGIYYFDPFVFDLSFFEEVNEIWIAKKRTARAKFTINLKPCRWLELYIRRNMGRRRWDRSGSHSIEHPRIALRWQALWNSPKTHLDRRMVRRSDWHAMSFGRTKPSTRAREQAF